MYCPQCGKRNEGDYKFCRGCGENLKVISNAMDRRWRKLLYHALDNHIRKSQRTLPVTAKKFHSFRWLYLICIGIYVGEGVFGDEKDWLVMALIYFLILLAGAWDYVSYKRLSASGSNNDKSSAQPASLRDSAVELPSTPTTNELAIPSTNDLAPPFSITESTTRHLEPVTAAEKRGGDLL